MSERGVQVSVARTRAGVISPRPVDERAVRDILGTVMDPELPMVSIAELGMVGAVTVDASIRVEVLPTYIGCPALEIIRSTVAERLGHLGRPVQVVATFATPWTAARITPAGSATLRAAGIATPTAGGATACPYCGSDQVVTENLFGATQCRSLLYCRACRQPFEAIKPG